MIRESKFPTVLVEFCYLSNVEDQAKVNTKAKREIMGREIAEGIIKTLDQIKDNNSSEEDKVEDKDEDKSDDRVENEENVSTPETTVKTATATDNVNVRKGPSTNYTSLGILKAGQKAEILGTDSATGWYKIKYNNGYGYVSNKYLKIDSSNEQSTSASTSYTDTDRTTGKTYYYKIRAYKTVGTSNVYSSYSSVVLVKPVLKTTSVKLTAGSKKLLLSGKNIWSKWI